MHLFLSIIYFALTFYIPIGIMITETHIRSLQNLTKFVKIAKNLRDSTITHKSRLLKHNINKSILNQHKSKSKLKRNQQPTTPRPGSALSGLVGSPWDGSAFAGSVVPLSVLKFALLPKIQLSERQRVLNFGEWF